MARIVTYAEAGKAPRAGLLRGESVIALEGPGGHDQPASVRELIAAGGLEQLDAADGAATPLGDVTLLPPVPDPEKIVCIGLNYHAHAAEAGMEPPSSPTIFAKFTNALTGSGAAVRLPAASEKVDFEAEVAVVIGKRCSSIGEDSALDAVAGYMLLNDLSARDLQFATPQWMAGKIFDGAAPCGPALVTPDQAGAHDSISFALDLNGERMQEASTEDLIFSVPALISELSRLTTLEPGDIISTGTPSGVGSTREPPVWLKRGDEIVISSPTLGELRTQIG